MDMTLPKSGDQFDDLAAVAESCFKLVNSSEEQAVHCILFDTILIPYLLPHMRYAEGINELRRWVDSKKPYILLMGPLQQDLPVFVIEVEDSFSSIAHNVHESRRVLAEADIETSVWICMSMGGKLNRYMELIDAIFSKDGFKKRVLQ